MNFPHNIFRFFPFANHRIDCRHRSIHQASEVYHLRAPISIAKKNHRHIELPAEVRQTRIRRLYLTIRIDRIPLLAHSSPSVLEHLVYKIEIVQFWRKNFFRPCVKCNHGQLKMYFHTEDDFQTPCGGNFHYTANSFDRSQRRDSDTNCTFSSKLNQANGEKAKFTYESSACKGTKFWSTKIESR